MFNEWTYGYWTTVLAVFVVSCALDAKRSLEDYRKKKIENKSDGMFLDVYHSWRNVRSEYDSIYYGMNIVNNVIGSVFFPWHVISYVLPHFLYSVFSCAPDPPVKEREKYGLSKIFGDLNESELGSNCFKPHAPDPDLCDKNYGCESKSEQEEKLNDEQEEEILYDPPGRLTF